MDYTNYERLHEEDNSDDELAPTILLMGMKNVGKRTLLQALKDTQKNEPYLLQNSDELRGQHYYQALTNAQHILLVFDKHNLESLEQLAGLVPTIKQKAPNAILTLVENKDDMHGYLRGVPKDPSFTGIGGVSFSVTTEKNDIQQFLKDQNLKNVQCITVSAKENKNIEALWSHIQAASTLSKDTLSKDTLSEDLLDTDSDSADYNEESQLLSQDREHLKEDMEQYLLKRIDEFTSEYNSAPGQIKHRMNQENLGHINSLATILIAGILSKNPIEFFARKTVERTLNEHLRALNYASPLSTRAVSNLIHDTFKTIKPDLPKQFPYVNYLSESKKKTSLFHQQGPKENAEDLINDIKKNAPYIKKI